MISSSRYTAACRVLSHFYSVRLRGKAGRRELPGGLGHVSQVLLRDGMMSVRGTVSRAVRLVTDRATQVVMPSEGGTFQITIEGARYLRVMDALTGEPSVTFSVTRRRNHVATLTRCLWELSTFPFVNGRDMRAYFLNGDSEAGDRLERRLLPVAESAGLVAIPRGEIGLMNGAVDGAVRAVATDPVLIILPVYNAADLVRECLDHLGRNTHGDYTVLILDDASPDPVIGPMLKDWVARHKQAQLIVNKENIGFVGTVNRGLEQARGRHVVLLNSDAMVPEGWLQRLTEPLRDPELGPGIASITPLSNDAEIFDVPVECHARVLAPGEAEAADRMARRLSWQTASAEAPTGVGFCMAMGRDWVARVPQLDTVFGRGYGEEVDWCRRTAAMGARHIGIGTLFVEHRSGSSFGDEKPQRVQENNKIISKRYPGYDLTVQQFRERDPLAGPRLAVGVAMLVGRAGRADRPFPMWLSHRWGGGAELWLQDQIRGDIAAQNGALVLRDASLEYDAAPGAMVVELHATEGVTRAILSAEDTRILLENVQCPLDIGYSCLAGARDPLGFMATICDIMDTRAMTGWTDRFTMLFHDYLPLCPSYTLIGHDRAYCGLPSARDCQACYAALPITSGKRPPMITQWRDQWESVARRATTLQVFSEDSRRHVAQIWPDLAPRIRMAPHQVDHLPASVGRRWQPGKPFTLGVLGAIGYNKGAGVLQRLAEKTDREFKLVVIGKIDPLYAHPKLLIHGTYDRDDIGKLIEEYQVDAWFLPSIWPETFSYTAHECLATGLDVFCFDLGAQADVVRAAPNGHVLPLDADLKAADFITVVLGAANNGSLYCENE